MHLIFACSVAPRCIFKFIYDKPTIFRRALPSHLHLPNCLAENQFDFVKVKRNQGNFHHEELQSQIQYSINTGIHNILHMEVQIILSETKLLIPDG